MRRPDLRAHGDGRGLEEPAGAWLDGLLARAHRASGRHGARLDDDVTALLIENRIDPRQRRDDEA